MNKNILILCGAVIILALVIVFAYPKISIANEPEIIENTTTIITLERTPCFGFCPTYKLTIFDDGRVFYEGDRFVNVSGNHTYQITPEKVVELVDEFNNINYFSLSNTSEGDLYCATDNPSVITSITVGNKTHSVFNYHGCPGHEDLRALEDKIDEVVGSNRWVAGN